MRVSCLLITMDALRTATIPARYFGCLLLLLSTKNASTIWPSDQADNLIEDSDLRLLAYFWETLKLDRIGRSLKKTGCGWAAAADLALWCLNGNPAGRPRSMRQVFEHKFFDPAGPLRFLDSMNESWNEFTARQAADLHAAVEKMDQAKVAKIFAQGAVHLSMIDEAGAPLKVQVLHRAAFLGNVELAEKILDQISDAWPVEVKKEYLDCRTALGLTPYMIACGCGYQDVADALVKKGCSTNLVNAAGKTGEQLAKSVMHEMEWSKYRPWNRGGKQHLAARDLESYLSNQQRAHKNKDVHAGLQLWDSKQLVYHFTKPQMRALEASIESLLEKNYGLAVSTCLLCQALLQTLIALTSACMQLHFTDLGSCRVILNGVGIRASVEGQLGGGVSVCLRSLVGFDWGAGWERFCLAVGKALWGSKWYGPMLPQY